jgi:VWFA-related protein
VAAAGASQDSAGAAAAGAAIGQAAAQQGLIEMESRMLQTFELLERDQQGFATINSLLAVIAPMRNLPGRKTLIFFSEGLSLPPAVQAKFSSVINAANRAGVSIYAVDSAGLRIESGAAEAAREINSLASQRMQQIGRNDRLTSGPYTKALERNEDLLRLDPRSGLGELADETGGFLIHDTNDLRAGLRRIDEDMRSFYFLTYVPKNNDYNGKFRQIEVKITRSNVEVQTRKGYYAIESPGSFPVLDYEAPALAAFRNARSNPGPIPLGFGALHFPAAGKPGLALVIAEAPISAFTVAPTSDNKNYSADFAIVALIRDQAGQVIQKVSQHYPLTGPIDKLEVAKKGQVIFYREVDMPPGRYTVELIAHDGPTAKATVRSASLLIDRFEESQLRMSSVAVLKRAEPISETERKHDRPFHFGELVVYPNLGEPLQKSTTKQVTFFFTAWPPKGSSEPLSLTVEILQDNRSLGQISAQLSGPDDQGRIKHASSLPLDGFPPGTFELKVSVRNSKTNISRSTFFSVKP